MLKNAKRIEKQGLNSLHVAENYYLYTCLYWGGIILFIRIERRSGYLRGGEFKNTLSKKDRHITGIANLVYLSFLNVTKNTLSEKNRILIWIGDRGHICSFRVQREYSQQKGQAYNRNSEPGVSVLFECNEEYSQRKEQDPDPDW